MRLVRLVGEGEQDELDEYSEQEDDKTVVADELAEEIKHVDNDKCIDPAEQGPSQGDNAVEVEAVVFVNTLVVRAEQLVVVGAEEEREVAYLRVA